MDIESPRLRLSILGIVVFSLFAALFARLWYLQVMATDQGEVEAAANRIRTIQEEPPRGRILDAKGRVIVDSRTSLVVTVDPHELAAVSKDERSDLLLRLATELTQSGIPTKVSSIERRLNDPQYSPLQPVPVAIDVPDDLMVFLAERADDFPSVQVRREAVRHYPEGSLAAHVIGYVGRISTKELESKMGTATDPKVNPKPYEPDSEVGKTGIERTFEDDLRGTPGVITVEVDSKGQVKNQVSHTKPVPGNDVQLTIDIDVQRATEDALADKLEALRGTRTQDYKIAQGKAGAAVVVDPGNGGVVAMASYPTYDPNEFVNGINSDRYQQLTGGDTADNPLVNRAIAGLYAPGSTFKLVTAYAALSKGLITASTPYNDTGSYTVGNYTAYNAGRQPHGMVSLASALTVSSDAFFYKLGDDFWQDRDRVGDGIQDTARQFGFGAPTGVQLPGELGGVLPDPAWKQQLWNSLPADQRGGDGKWYAGDNVNMATGQGDVLATPLQIANSYATLAAHGVRYQPTLVLRVLKAGGAVDDPASVVRTIDPVVAATVAMPAEYYDPLHQGFAGVTSSRNPLGTATAVFEGFDQSHFEIMGKTGTAEASGKTDSSLFVGVGPTDDPKYATMAILEQSGFGSDAAGPVVRTIFEHVTGQDRPDRCDQAGSDAQNGSATSTSTTPGTTPEDCPPVGSPNAAGTPSGGVSTPNGGNGYGTNGNGTGGSPATTAPPYTPTTRYTTPTTSYTPPSTSYPSPTTVPVAPTTPTSGAPPTSAGPGRTPN